MILWVMYGILAYRTQNVRVIVSLAVGNIRLSRKYFNILSFLWMSASNARIMADDESCEIDPELIFAVLMLFAVNSSRGVHLHIQYEDQYLFNVWFV